MRKGLFAAAAICSTLALLLPVNAQAATVSAQGEGATADYSYPWPGGGEAVYTGWAGTWVTSVGKAYCIDLNTELRVGDNVAASSWGATTGGALTSRDLAIIASIIRNEYPNVSRSGYTNNEQAAAVQAAIWHFSDELTGVANVTSGGDQTKIIALYNDIVAKATPPTSTATSNAYGTLPTDPRSEFSINVSRVSGGTFEGPIGTVLGPYRVAFTGFSTATVTAANAVVTDASGTPIATPISATNGQLFYMKATANNRNVRIVGSASGMVAPGRTYYTRGVQKIISVAPTAISLSDDAYGVSGVIPSTTTVSTSSTTRPATSTTTSTTRPPKGTTSTTSSTTSSTTTSSTTTSSTTTTVAPTSTVSTTSTTTSSTTTSSTTTTVAPTSTVSTTSTTVASTSSTQNTAATTAPATTTTTDPYVTLPTTDDPDVDGDVAVRGEQADTLPVTGSSTLPIRLGLMLLAMGFAALGARRKPVCDQTAPVASE